MVNFNGTITGSESSQILNRGFLYGDAIFETIKVANGKILFWEDHYFRLMASMRILRMQIPMQFTMEFLEQEILMLINENKLATARVRMTVYRNSGGYYLPKTQTVSYVIEATALENSTYVFSKNSYEVELFKDFYITKHLLSTLKTTNKLVQITASIFANENGYQSCLMMNEDKNIVEAISGNLFMFLDGKIITPPITEGCLNGVMRKQIIGILNQKNTNFIWEERPISPFELQKADELFITNTIIGVQAITKYRKRNYTTLISEKLIIILNQSIQ
uniref:aminotransferase class IV n=1 Tax=Flavobacterium sp. TaxID=239 RepID=UPI0040495317